jgi:hypothetical protein
MLQYSIDSAMFARPSRIHIVFALMSVVIMAAICGCGSGGPEVVRVRGTVTHQGKPLPNILLNFSPEKGRPSWGLTDAEGRYSLNYSKDRDGAVTGKHIVCLSYKPSGPREEMSRKIPEVLAKYSNAATTPLEFDITTDNQVVDIELE